jgi:hypothetical protein
LTFQGFGLTKILKMGEVYESVFDGPRKEAVADGKNRRDAAGAGMFGHLD